MDLCLVWNISVICDSDFEENLLWFNQKSSRKGFVITNLFANMKERSRGSGPSNLIFVYLYSDNFRKK